MDLSKRLSLSYYINISTIDESHNVFLVKHSETGRIYIKKILEIYNKKVYDYLQSNPVKGTPRIIELYEDDDTLTVIEEYIGGITLDEYLENNKITFEEILHILISLTTIIEGLHNASPKIIHRDIKPSNIIISGSLEVFLLDFNAAKFYNSNAEKDTVLLGTEGYAAPEQYGFSSSDVTSDIYSIGVVLKQLIKAGNIKNEKLSKIAEKCTKIDKSMRYKNVTNLKNEFIFLSKISNSVILQNLVKLTPPGFRSGNVRNMLMATCYYLFAFNVCRYMTLSNTKESEMLGARIIGGIILYFPVFIYCDYLNITRFLPSFVLKNKILAFIGKFIFYILVVFSSTLIYLFLSSIMQGL